MNFDLTEERQMLQDSLRRFLRDKYDTETRNRILESMCFIEQSFGCHAGENPRQFTDLRYRLLLPQHCFFWIKTQGQPGHCNI